MNGLLERVERTLGKHDMLAAGRRVAVAVSGGSDSVGLLLILRELASHLGLDLSVVHVDHRLRGQESDEDAAFVSALAKRLGLRFHLRVPEIAGANLEEGARKARLGVYRELVRGGEADRVAVGHTRSDQAETVLFRFLRGAGTAGLAAIRPVTDLVIRPLLEVEREELQAWLCGRGEGWRRDSSNDSCRFARNRIRHELMPRLAVEWNPRIEETLAHTAEWAQAEEEYWSAEIERVAAGLVSDSADGLLVEAPKVAALPLAVGRRVVRSVIFQCKGDTRGVDFHHIEAILELAARTRGHGRVQIPGLETVRSFEWLLFRRTSEEPCGNYRIRISPPGQVAIPGTKRSLSLELIEKPETSEVADCVYNSVVGCLDWGSLSRCLDLRNWQAGDRYQPQGSTGIQKIKTLFQQERIPAWERSRWPVLTDGTSIVWARRFGAAAGVSAHPGTRPVLRIREVAGPGN